MGEQISAVRSAGGIGKCRERGWDAARFWTYCVNIEDCDVVGYKENFGKAICMIFGIGVLWKGAG